MKTYVFRVVVEPDDDGWVAYSPALKERGGATWGHTSEEAMENIRQVLQMTVESLTNKESRFRSTGERCTSINRTSSCHHHMTRTETSDPPQQRIPGRSSGIYAYETQYQLLSLSIINFIT